jgi:hypothetical protein
MFADSDGGGGGHNTHASLAGLFSGRRMAFVLHIVRNLLRTNWECMAT